MTKKLVLIIAGLVLTYLGWWFIGAVFVILGFEIDGTDKGTPA